MPADFDIRYLGHCPYFPLTPVAAIVKYFILARFYG